MLKIVLDYLARKKIFYIDEYGLYIFPCRISTEDQVTKILEEKKLPSKYLNFYHQFKIAGLYFFIRK